jgi:DNA-binding beta-propeller fold protein YncE
MNFNRSIVARTVLLITLIASLTLLSNRSQADTGSCGGVTVTLPFTDVMGNAFFCQIAAAYFSGLTNGTTATTYSPTQTVTREQMAAFITRTMDQSLKRGSKKAVTEKWWTPQNANSLTLTDVDTFPKQVKYDGTDLWVVNGGGSSVMRIRPSDGKLLDTWTGAFNAEGIVCAMGRIFVAGRTSPGRVYMIDPTQPAGAVTTLSSNLGNSPYGIAFDGSRIWTANSTGSVSIVSLNPTSVTTVTTGFNAPFSMLYDGSNIWVIDIAANTLLKLDANGMILQTINVGNSPTYPVFDGTNIWMPRAGNSVAVVRVKDAVGRPLETAFILATLTGNGLDSPQSAAFDGERILVTNFFGNRVSLWKAADLTPLGFVSTGDGTHPFGACSDGLNFWITLRDARKLARF